MEKDRNINDDELEVEEVDDIEEDDDDIEEYDFNDEDYEADGEDEDAEDDGEAEEAEESEASEDEGESDEGEAVEEPAPAEEKPADKLTPAQERELKLLHKLGYDGTYEEAVAAYEKEQSKPAAEGSEPAAEKSAEATPPVPDYEAMAKQMLADINNEYKLNLTDYSDFEDLATFADLSRDERVGPIKAFAATNPKMMERIAQKAAMEKLSKPQRNVKPLPKSDGGKGGTARGETVSSQKIAEYRELFPGMSREAIIKLIKKANR